MPLGKNQPMPCIHPPGLTRRQFVAGGALTTAATSALRAQPTPARVWRVGPGQHITRIADALARAADGDRIEVLPGTYRADVAVIHQRRLTIVGVGHGEGAPGNARPLLQAAGQHAEGKAIWVVRDGDVRIDNIAFEGTRVPDGNGAAIRFERGSLSLSRCAFSNHQIGLLTGNHADAVLDIDHCDFSDAPVNTADLSHLLYVGRIAQVRIRNSRFWRGLNGHLIKSRARESVLTDNQIDDGPLGEASYEVEFPNGGKALVEGNTVVQSARSRNPTLLSYGAEGQFWAENGLTLRNNTFVNRLPSGGFFVRVWSERLPTGTPVRSQGNRYLGPGSLVLGPQGESVGDERGPVR